jgi:hypothetical protein
MHSPNLDYTHAGIRLIPVYGNGKANEVGSKATPSGEIKMLITNRPAIAYAAGAIATGCSSIEPFTCLLAIPLAALATSIRSRSL